MSSSYVPWAPRSTSFCCLTNHLGFSILHPQFPIALPPPASKLHQSGSNAFCNLPRCVFISTPSVKKYKTFRSPN
ncbi:unnamed protein product [Triticum turgidum subsp. durum]|uniref:Uncharacterized protein n=1 Tax=Triticum turgidum subsp. durum TaxID=4567 RepID=A0A9R1PCK5_TRITD|nr:unnamed protein product [Triticum turgidum subsp. durum]